MNQMRVRPVTVVLCHAAQPRPARQAIRRPGGRMVRPGNRASSDMTNNLHKPADANTKRMANATVLSEGQLNAVSGGMWDGYIGMHVNVTTDTSINNSGNGTGNTVHIS
jgi:hypothetical protein